MFNFLKKTLPCPEGLDTSVMREVWRRLESVPSGMTIWMSGSYSTDHWYPVFARWQEKIDKLRAWAEKQEGACLRKAYKKWIDHYERNLNGARHELETHEQDLEMKAYHEKNAAKNKIAEDYAASCPIVKPPATL